jgi:hypothetical protein
LVHENLVRGSGISQAVDSVVLDVTISLLYTTDRHRNINQSLTQYNFTHYFCYFDRLFLPAYRLAVILAPAGPGNSAREVGETAQCRSSPS